MSLYCSTLVEKGCMDSFDSCTRRKMVAWLVNSIQSKSSYNSVAVKIVLDTIVLIFIVSKSCS